MPRIATKPDSAQQLRALEDVLTTAKRWAMEEARALLEIQDRELWRCGDWSSFEEYGTTRWGYDRSMIFRLTQWARVIRTVSPIGDPPARESTARPLYGLTEEQQVQAWKAATRRNADPTAKEVSEAVSVILRRDTRQRPAEEQQQASGEIVRGDAAKMLGTLPDASIDLLLTSPPYAMQRAAEYPSIPEADYPRFTVAWMNAAKPKLTASGSVMIVIRENVKNGVISDYVLRSRLAIRDAGWHEIDTLIWVKPDAPPTGRPDRPRRAYEYVLWYSLTTTPYCRPKEIGTPLKDKRERMARIRSLKGGHHAQPQPFMRFSGTDGTARVTDLITAPIGTSAAGVEHPAMYPLTLADQLVRTYSPARGRVGDCFAGSGTTLLAAKNAGRNWWGADITQKYVNLARRRLA